MQQIYNDLQGTACLILIDRLLNVESDGTSDGERKEGLLIENQTMVSLPNVSQCEHDYYM